MIIPEATVLAMKQQYVTMKSDAHEGLGYNAKDPVLRAQACEVLAQAFAPYPIHPDDLTINCITIEGSPGNYELVFRATWDPAMADVLLVDENGYQPTHLSSPQNSVTRSCGVRTWNYHLAGFDTVRRLYVFAAVDLPTAMKEKLAA